MRVPRLIAAVVSTAIAGVGVLAMALPARAADLPVIIADVSISDGDVPCSGGGTYHVAGGVVTGHSGCLGEISLGSGVTSIAYGAFRGVQATSLTMGDSVTAIGGEAFNEASQLAQAIIGNSVTTIGDYAFQGTALTSVVLGNSVTSIGYQSFRRIPTLTSFTFGAAFHADGVGTQAFEYANIATWAVDPANTELMSSDGVVFTKDGAQLVMFPMGRTGSYTVPDSVTSLGANAFSGSHITSVTLNSSITSLPNYAFYGSSLESIDLSHVTTVGTAAFQRAHLSTLTIPPTLTSIGPNAFGGNPLTTLIIPSTLTYIGNDAFRDLSSLQSVTIQEGVTALPSRVLYASGAPHVTLPSSLTTIPDEMFNESRALTSVTIPSGVTTISEYAFQGTGLTKVVVGPDVVNIKHRAFASTSHLETVVLPDGLTSIGSQVFASSSVSTIVYCGSDTSILTSPVLPVAPQCLHVAEAPTITGATSTGGTTVDLDVTPPAATPDSPITTYTATSSPGGITTTAALDGGVLHVTGLTPDTTYTFTVTADNLVGSSAQSDPSSSVTTASTVACPGGGTYHVSSGVVDSNANCAGDIVFPSGITAIGNSAFDGNRLVTSVILPNTLTSIGYSAFANMNLPSIVVPDSVTSLGGNAFYENRQMTSATIGAGVTTIPTWCFMWGAALSSVTFRGQVTSIGSSAFENTNLGQISIPSSVTEISSSAFRNAHLASVTLNAGLTSLGGSAFDSNPRLTSITLPATLSVLGSGPFSGTGITDFGVAQGNATFQSVDGVLFNAGATQLLMFPPARTGSYTVPSNVTSLGAGSFAGTQVEQVTIGSNVTSIGGAAFSGAHVTSMVIPDSVTSFGSQMFMDARWLTSVTLGSGITEVPLWTFINAVSLHSVTLRGAVTAIRDNAFSFTNLGTFVVPSTVTTIEWWAFRGAHLTSISLPSGLTTLGPAIFDLNSNLTAVIFCGDPSVFAGQDPAVTPLCISTPDAPAITEATVVDDTTIDLAITPPASDGGSPVIDYTATSSPGDVQVTGSLVDGVLRVTGLAPGTAYTFTVTANNLAGPSAVSGQSSSVSTLAAALVPQMGNPTATVDGFTATITNFDAAWIWTAEATNGGEAVVDDNGILTVTNLEPGEASTVTVRTTRPGYVSGSTDINGQSLQSGLIPTFGVPSPEGTGFVVQIANFDSDYQWSAQSDIGQASVDGSGQITVTGLEIGEQATLTVTSSRSGYSDASSQVTGSRLFAPRTPVLSVATATATGFTFQIENFDAAWNWAGEATNGGSAAIGDTGLVTVTGISSGASSTVTITSSRAQYQDGTADVTGMRLNVARTPVLGTPTATGGGFTVQITNYDRQWQWAATATNGGSASIGNTGLVTVTGMAVGESSTVTVTATRTGYVTGSAETTATRLKAARTPDFDTPVSTVEGYTVQITNFSSEWRWSGTATNGGTVSISDTGVVTVTGMRVGASSEATITNSRAGYVNGTANVTGSRLKAALTPAFGAVKSTQNGYTVQITNFDDAYTWSGTATNGGTVTVSTTGLIAVTGMSEGGSSKATITAERRGYVTGRASVTGTRLSAALAPQFGPVTQTTDGFKAQITNYVAEFTWTATATAGATVKVSSTGLIVVSGLAKATDSTVTVKTTRAGYVGGVATVASASLPGVTSMTPEQIAMLTAKDVAAIPVTTWGAIGAGQMRAFTPAAITGMSSAVFKVLKPGLLAALTVTQVPALSLDCIKAANKSIIGDMSAAALVGLTVEQIKVLPQKAAQAVTNATYVKMSVLQQQALRKAQGA